MRYRVCSDTEADPRGDVISVPHAAEHLRVKESKFTS
jgi:hypothetical protein